MNIDIGFSRMLKDILDKGSDVTTRNSITKRLAGLTISFDSTPLISIRKTAWKNALREFEWFMSGSSNINNLHDVRLFWLFFVHSVNSNNLMAHLTKSLLFCCFDHKL